MTRLQFGTRSKSKRILEIIHSDVCGPITPIAIDGSKYFVTFIDDFSNFTVVYLIKNKSEVFGKLCNYISMVHSMFGSRVSRLRCDNGGEYVSQEIVNYCGTKGIILDYTVPYTPEQNGKAERMNRTLVEKGRAMMDGCGISKDFWGEAIRTATYILNRSPSSGLVDCTPAEVWYGRKPDVTNLRIFGALAYSHIPKAFRNKFDSKAEKCVMVGYAPTGYRLYSLERNKIIISRDVQFDEGQFFFKNNIIDISNSNSEDISDSIVENNSDKNLKDSSDIQIENENGLSKNVSNRRVSKPPVKYDDYELYMAGISFVENIPHNYEELQNRSDKEEWLKSINRELDSIVENNTWEEVDRTLEMKILDTKWVFSYKDLESCETEKYKARLVVRGFAQEKNRDYQEVYSPVAKMSTIRLLLVVGNQFGFYFEQLDVKTAFLNGILNENVYIYPPKGVTCKSGKVLKLKKSLYGLKQSSKCWNNEINGFLLELGFTRSDNDFCLYSLKSESGKLYLLLYVDDIILCGPDLMLIKEIKLKLMAKFKMKDKGNLRHFLGLEIYYDRKNGILRLSQSRYIQSILCRFRFEMCKPSAIPIDPKLRLEPCEYDLTGKPYRELLGCLMYLMLGTRPDICFVLNYFSRLQDRASDMAWNHLKKVLRYLKGTSNMGLEYRRQNKQELVCYVDADWGGDTVDRKSVSGFVFKVFGNSISWATRKQNCVALSTTEAELIALSISVCEGLWLKRLLCDFGIETKKVIFCEDNQGCIALIKSPENNRRVKHIDLKYHFLCEHLQNGSICISYIESKHQQADILTKGLPSVTFVRHRINLGLRDFSEVGCCE